jgi:hypothetical protein
MEPKNFAKLKRITLVFLKEKFPKELNDIISILDSFLKEGGRKYDYVIRGNSYHNKIKALKELLNDRPNLKEAYDLVEVYHKRLMDIEEENKKRRNRLRREQKINRNTEKFNQTLKQEVKEEPKKQITQNKSKDDLYIEKNKTLESFNEYIRNTAEIARKKREEKEKEQMEEAERKQKNLQRFNLQPQEPQDLDKLNIDG